MKFSQIIFLQLFILLIITVDIFLYRQLKDYFRKETSVNNKVRKALFWILPGFLISGVILFSFFYSAIPSSKYMHFVHVLSGTFFLFYVPKLVAIDFYLLEKLLKSTIKIFRKILGKPGTLRLLWTKWIYRIGWIVAGIVFLMFAYGIIYGRYDYKIREETLLIDDLPAELDGIRIVHFSDLHIGSFIRNEKQISKAVELMNEQKPDLILFTGDFVNNVSLEIDEFIPALSALKAKIGMYSVLGNHDYGEYIQWKTEEEKEKDKLRLIEIQENLGFKVLLNETAEIQLGPTTLEILGVENWGLPPFPQYGDLEKTLKNTDTNSFRILLSHDPTHWKEKVKDKKDIDLTLSGHTHGGQFGFELNGLRWSPVNLRYEYWGGLYRVGDQYLNVSTGIGFIGYPGRIGMPPEIVLIELKRNTKH